jgi:hypothetical protein
VEGGAQAREIHPVEALAIDRVRGDDANGDALGAPDDGAEELLSIGGRHLLRVIQQPERTDTMVAQARVVEQDARDDQWAGERAAPGLIRAGDEASAELTVEAEELLSGADGHWPEDSPASGHGSASAL